MPGRETLKRRLLRLLDALVNPPEVRSRKPTKAELLVEQKRKVGTLNPTP